MSLSTYAKPALVGGLDERNRNRSRSFDDLSIEEISPDDIGYDADVEVIRPDKYEEVGSDFEDAPVPQESWTSVDEELAARMTQLGREQLMSFEQSADRGRKRGSVEMEDDETLLWIPLPPEVEAQGRVNASHHPSPAKRRRKKSRRPHSVQQTPRNHGEIWANSLDTTGSARQVQQDASTSSTPSEQAATRNGEDDDMMDVT